MGSSTNLSRYQSGFPIKKSLCPAPITNASWTKLSDGKIVFLAFRRDLVADAPERVTIRVIAKVMRTMTFGPSGKPVFANLENLWAVRGNSYEFRVAPLSETQEMIAIRSESDDFSFPAGRYALMLKGQAYDFSVEGPITESVQCLERTEAVNGAVYSECRSP